MIFTLFWSLQPLFFPLAIRVLSRKYFCIVLLITEVKVFLYFSHFFALSVSLFLEIRTVSPAVTHSRIWCSSISVKKCCSIAVHYCQLLKPEICYLVPWRSLPIQHFCRYHYHPFFKYWAPLHAAILLAMAFDQLGLFITLDLFPIYLRPEVLYFFFIWCVFYISIFVPQKTV